MAGKKDKKEKERRDSKKEKDKKDKGKKDKDKTVERSSIITNIKKTRERAFREVDFPVDDRLPSQIPTYQLPINRLDVAGLAPLHWAARNGDAERVRVLIKNRADVNLQDAAGRSALEWAFDCDHKYVARLLVECGGQIPVGKEGRIPSRQTFVSQCEVEMHSNVLEATKLNCVEIDLSFSYFNRFPGNELKSITSLTISFNNLVDIKDIVREMPQVTELDASHNVITELPLEIANLQMLKALDISHNYITKLPDALCEIDTLKKLNIAVNELEEFPPVVVHVSSLVDLNLSHNFLQEVPTALGDLVLLEKLDLSDNYITLLRDIAFDGLPNLESLNLDNNRIISMRFYDLMSSRTLHTLRYEHNNFPTEMRRILDCFYHSGLSLDLSDLALNSLPREITLLTNLQSLSLRNNNFTQVPAEVESLTSLTELDLSFLRLTDLPLFMHRMTKLTKLDLEETRKTIESPPPKVIAGGCSMIVGFFKDKLEGDACWRLKLMIVGQENVGKSTLLHALRQVKLKKRSKRPNISTDGIDISDWEVRDSESKKPIIFSAWDFAGQEIYYSTHSFFISSRAIYVVVFDLRYGEDQSKVDFWLNSVASRARKAPVLLVGTHLDEFEGNLPAVERILTQLDQKYSARFPNITGITAVGCPTFAGVDPLCDMIVQAAQKSPFVQEQMPAIYLELEDVITSKKKEIIPPALNWKEYQDCAAAGGFRDEEQLLRATNFLSDLGSIVFFEDQHSKERLVIIDPQWLTNMFASVITTKHQFVKSGVLTHRDLGQIWRAPEYPPRLHAQLISLLKDFEILYEMKDDSGEITYLLPSFLPEERPNIQLHWPDVDDESSEYCRFYKLLFVPNGLFSRLMVRLMSFCDKPLFYWRHGVLCIRGKDKTLVKISNGVVKLFTRGPTAAELLRVGTEIIDSLVDDWFKVDVDWVKVPCPHCRAEQLPEEKVHMFELAELEEAAASGETRFVICQNMDAQAEDEEVQVRLDRVVPDIAMADFHGCLIQYNDLDIDRKLGKGSFGIIYKGSLHGEDVAIKRLKVDESMLVAAFAEFRREVWLMSALSHPCITNLKGYSMKPLSMVMELVSGGDLWGYLHDEEAPLDWQIRYKLAIDMARGMAFLHSINPPLLHRDLKSPNVLVCTRRPKPGEKVMAKIADFGLSSRMFLESYQDRAVENPTWCAPEVMQRQPYTEKADVYSYGIMLWELITREQPFAEYTFQYQVEDDVIRGLRPDIPASTPAFFADLTRKCWHAKPVERPAFHDIVHMLEAEISTQFGADFLYCINPDVETKAPAQGDHPSSAAEASSGPRVTKTMAQEMELGTNGFATSLLLMKRQVWVGLSTGNMMVFSSDSGQLLTLLHHSRSSHETTCLVEMNDMVLSGSSDGYVSLWRPEEWKPQDMEEKAVGGEVMMDKASLDRLTKKDTASLKRSVVGIRKGITGTGKNKKLKKLWTELKRGNVYIYKAKSDKYPFFKQSLRGAKATKMENQRIEIFFNSDLCLSFVAKTEADGEMWVSEINKVAARSQESNALVSTKEVVFSGSNKRISCMIKIESEVLVGCGSDRISVLDENLNHKFEINLQVPRKHLTPTERVVVHDMKLVDDALWVAAHKFIIRLNPRRNFEQINILGPCPDVVQQLALNGNGAHARVFSLLQDGRIGSWNVGRARIPATWPSLAEPGSIRRFYCLAESGNLLWIGSDSRVCVVDVATLSVRCTLETDGPTVSIIPVLTLMWTASKSIRVWR